MRFMMIMYPGPDAEAGVLPDQQALAEMGKFNEEMVKAGVLLAGEGLHPSSTGARVRFPGGKAQASDGPFTEAKEIVGGFWLIQAKSKEEAVAWASRCPCSRGEMIEIRRVFETEDFAASDPTGELREAEAKLRKQAAANR
ncbi:MAG: YciI family protein [Pseudomonadota bacterium]